jgi:phosphate transport system ATP-binding protein
LLPPLLFGEDALKCLNRINENIPGVKITGDILLDSMSIHDKLIEACRLRRRFGWVAQQPYPFLRSVYENVAYGARINGIVAERKDIDNFVEGCLRAAGLRDEVKGRLRESGTRLSGGQQSEGGWLYKDG